MYLLKYFDILGEKTQQDDMKCLHEDHAASKSHLHLHSIQHLDFQLQPVIRSSSEAAAFSEAKGSYQTRKDILNSIYFQLDKSSPLIFSLFLCGIDTELMEK